MCHYPVKVTAVGVGDEYLAEAAVGDELHDALHAVGIELVEYIVEQQERFQACGAVQKFVLGKAQGYGECLALALRAGALHWHAVEREQQVVAVGPHGCVAHYFIMAAGGVEVP